MPIINIPSRNVQLNFPDTMSDEEIQSAIEKEYPRSGEDVALEIDQVKNAALEGRDLVNPFDQMSNDDYVLYRKHLADKKTSFGDAIGIAKDTFGHIIDEVSTGIGTTAYNLYQGDVGNVAESAKEGVIAGYIGLTDIAGKILNPAQPIPSKEDFIGKRTTRLVDNPNFPNAAPMEVEDVTNEEDYNKLIEAEKQRDAGIVNNLYAMEFIMRGAPIEEVSRGFQYVDPTLLAGAGGALVKSAGKTLFTKAAARAALGTAGTVGASTAPSALGRAGLSAVEGAAGAVQGVASLPSKALQAVGRIAESVAPGSGVGAQATALTASAMGDLGLTAGVVGGAKATEKVAEVVGAAARIAKQEASRTGLLEQVALDATVSPAGRKFAAGMAQLQPVGRAVLDITKGAAKGAAAGSVVGGALGGLAERNLEGVAAGFGAGGALGGITGAFHGAFELGKEAVGGSTSRTRQQATGDLNTFITTRPEIEQAAWSDTMSKLVAKIGPERAASQLDAMRVAEASGGKLRVATLDEIKQGLAPGWVNIDGMEIVLNPEKIRGDTAAHESAHVLFNSVINRAFRPEIEAAIYGIADPVTGQIVKAGVFDDIALGKVAEQIRDAYGKNTVAANEFQGFANTLKNSTDADSLSNARSRIADEMTAAYTGRLFERTRAGRFNPDRLPLVYRKVLSAIEDGVLDKFRSVIFEKGMDLGFDNVAKTFKDKNGKPIRIPELDAIVKKAYAQKLKTVDVTNAKPDLIPVNPADRALWAKTYGGARGVLNDNGTPKSQSQIDAEAAARWQDMTSRLSALPDSEKIGIDFSRDKAGKTVMTAKGQLSPTALTAILDSGALDPSAKAVLVEVLNSMQRADKSTFDTRYYGVYTRGKGGNKMVAGVKSASQNEILPYSVEINSKDGVLIRAVDVSKVRDRLATAMTKPEFKSAFDSPADALKGFRKYMDNITQINAVDSATLLGGGVKGATRRNLFYDALGFRLRNGETLLNAPQSVVNKSQNTIKSYRAERFAKLVDSGNKFAFEEATTYERGMRNFQPSAFTPESLPNGESFTNPDGYRILNKAGSKLFRTYDDTGKLIGIAESKEKAMKKAQDEFAKKAMKEEPATSKSPTEMRFQPVTPEQDAAFLSAAKTGDTEAAQRLVDEAAENGKLVEGWHAGSVDNVFNIKAGEKTFRHESSALGAFFGPREQAAEYGEPRKFYLRLNNPFELTERMQSELDTTAKARLARMRLIKDGYDGVKIGNELVAFDPSQIKSADPITYDNAGNIIPLSQRFNQASPDIRFQPSSITARDINTIAKEVGGGEVKGGAKKFGAFMREMRDKGITIRDVVKSYGITLSSIQRQERLAQTIKKNWPDAPFEDGVKIRPEDAFATLLGTEEGQSYLNAAEKGEFNEAAVDVMMQKFKSFGFQNKLKEQMKVAAEEFFPKATSIIDAVNNMPADEFAEFVRSNVRGISYGKVGFWSGHLGRGDIPTFDSRMGKLVYGKEVPVSNKVLMGQKERLPMLGITVPDEYKDFAQTLLHHEVWDRLNNSDTEHAPIKEAMLRFQATTPEDDYRGTHRAPTGEFGEGSLDAMNRTYPDDIYSAQGWRFYGDGESLMDKEAHRVITKLKGKPDATVTVYRSVPKGTAKQINPNDWVTTVKGYAKMHGERFDGGMDILSKQVKASELFTEGNSMFEFGWSPKAESSKRFQPDAQATTAAPDFSKTPAGDKPLLEVIYFKNQDKFKKAVAQGRVQKGVPIETFENMALAIHQPDSAMVGDVVMKGETIVNAQGGAYYPVLFGEGGSFWASTEKAANAMAAELNKISRLNNGKALMGLTSAPIDKLFSSTTMANGTMKLLYEASQSPRRYGINKSAANKMLVDAVNTPLVITDTKTGKVTTFKFNQRLRSSSSIEDNMALIKVMLDPDKSVFPLRKHFVENIARSIADHLSKNKKASQQFADLISPSSNKYPTAFMAKGKLAKSGIIQALGDLFSEEFIKDFQSVKNPGGVGGYLYAIIEMDGEVTAVKNKQHASYDYSIDSTSGQQPKVHILDKPVKWNDTLGLVKTQDYVPESIKDNIYPTSVGFSFSEEYGNLMVMKPKKGALASIEITRFQPDPTSPNILNGSDGSRIIKSNSGKYRVYLATGALAGVKETLESAQKLIERKSNK